MAVTDLDSDFWRIGMTLFAFGAIGPWLAMIDPRQVRPVGDTMQVLDIAPIASRHSPVLNGTLIRAFDHSILDQIIAATSVAVA